MNESSEPVILPPAFPAAATNAEQFIPSLSEQMIELDPAQLESFRMGNKMELTTWFNPVDPALMPDTLFADYPIRMNIVLVGTMKGKEFE